MAFFNDYLTGALPSGHALTRASSASTVSSAGELVSASANAPRFPYRYESGAWSPKGLLVEPASTNLMLNSAAQAAGTYARSSVSAADSFKAALGQSVSRMSFAPGGTQTAVISVTSGQNYTASRWVQGDLHGLVTLTIKAVGSENGVRATFDLMAKTAGSATPFGTGWTGIASRIEDFAGGWYRLSVTATVGASSAEVVMSYATRDVFLPTGLGWPLVQYPVPITQTAGAYACAIEPRDYVNQAIWTGTAYYVDVATGNDARTGLGSFANALQSINRAITLGNAAGVPFRVFVKAGIYWRETSINGADVGARVVPTQPCALIADGGRVVHSATTNWTYPAAPDVTFTNSYVGGPSNAYRVLDRLSADGDGIFTELTKVASAALVDSTPNSWAEVSGKIHIRRTDGLRPTMANTVITRAISCAQLTGAHDMYIEGFDFEGGPDGACHPNTLASCNFVFKSCSFKYAGNAALYRDGLYVLNVNGLVLCHGCNADGNTKDGFNAHADESGQQPYLLTINCRGIGNGIAASSSNNGLTIHDNVIGIDVNGEYRRCYDGEPVAIIETSKLALFGTAITTVSADGNALRGCASTDGTSQMWLDGCVLTSDGRGVVVRGTSVMRTKRSTVTGTEVIVSGATYAASWADGGGFTTTAPFLPAGLNWPAAYPVPIAESAGVYSSTLDPRDYVNAAIWTGPQYYVDVATGNDSNSGLTSYANATKSIARAIALGNAGGVPFRVLVKPGRYSFEWGIRGNNSTQPTQPCALVADAGRVTHVASTDWTFPGTTDATYTNSYVGGPSSALRIFDRLNIDADGNFAELTPVADAATCDSTPNSWVDVGSFLQIRRADGLQPTQANTLISRMNVAGSFTSGVDFYIEGFDFQGGSAAAFGLISTAAFNLVFDNCTFKYAGSASVFRDGLAVEDVNGLVLLRNCIGARNTKDAFNFHDYTSGSQTYVLTLGCSGIANGIAASSNNNGLTLHENVIGVDIGGTYRGCTNGAPIAIIDTSRLVMFGPAITHVAATGGATYAPVYTDGTAQLWIDGGTLTSDDRATNAQGTSIIRMRRNSYTGSIVKVAAATVSDAWDDAHAFVFGNQFELGSAPTSYIATGATTATRAADVYSFPVAASPALTASVDFEYAL